AHSALAYAREMVRGTHASGYQDLPLYLYKIEQANPGTKTKLEVDAANKFKYLFIAFDACIKGFIIHEEGYCYRWSTSKW
ncbi:hypothetical protein, partial [Moraxella catarrhalis]|uniref:hypothetical protein n=1 Tax=Moraxella catarrhalis TaxID=480 RepID=UPI001EEF56F1